MKKIVIYVNSLSRGGAERVSINLAKYMNSKGIKCYIVTERVAENEYELPGYIERVSINAGEKKYVNYLKNICELRKKIKEINPDLILIMDLSSCLLAIPAIKGLQIKSIVSERNDPTHFPGKKIVFYLSRYFMKKADGFVFQTNDAKEYYKKIVNNRGVVIPNPIYIEDIPEPYNGQRLNEIVSLGRLTEQKNQKMLINSFANIVSVLGDYKLIIYGEGELRKELTQQIKDLSLEEFVLLPGNKTDVLEKIKKSKLFVLPSDYEGMPNALIEAMSLGIPCISTDCPIGGPKDIIKHCENGMLVPVGDADMLSSTIIEVLQNEKLYEKLSKNGVIIRECLDSKVICERWKVYMEKLVNTNDKL